MKLLPEPVRVDVTGREAGPGEGTYAAYVPSPFRFCLRCRTSYEQARGNNFAKLAKLSAEGRSSAMSLITASIFEALHRAGLVVVDLTGVRPNCTMELGYALARRRRVVISAKKGTRLPFDGDKLPTYLWEDAGTRSERIGAYRQWFDRNSELPPVVE
jgi:hypothetical protein